MRKPNAGPPEPLIRTGPFVFQRRGGPHRDLHRSGPPHAAHEGARVRGHPGDGVRDEVPPAVHGPDRGQRFKPHKPLRHSHTLTGSLSVRPLCPGLTGAVLCSGAVRLHPPVRPAHVAEEEATVHHVRRHLRERQQDIAAWET